MATHNHRGEDSMGDLEAAEIQLIGLARDYAQRLDHFLGSYDPDVPQMIEGMATALTTGLVAYRNGGTVSDVDARMYARQVRALVPNPDPGFWRTALGRLVAWADGYSHPIVPRVQAAAILGYTRQRISQLEQAGVLETAPDQDGVTNASVLRKLRAGRG